jgi:hypothetical protein
MAAGNYGEACPKLEESQRLDPGGGTLLNLALCHEKQGKLASAWAEFNEALAVARRDGRADRITAAQQHIAALEPKLSQLTVNVTSPIDGEALMLDGEALGRAAWGTPLSLDAGAHELAATAPGRQPWRENVALGLGEKKTLAVPVLEPAPTATTEPPADEKKASPAPNEETAPQTHGKNRTLAYVIGGAGIAALGVGTYFGIDTLHKKNQSDDECPTDTTCTPRGVELNNQAHTSAWIANISLGVGVIGVGVATYLLLADHGAPQGPAKSGTLTLDARAVRGGGELGLRGTW